MVKKKKVKKAKKILRAVKKKKVSKVQKKGKNLKAAKIKKTKEKVLGKIDHYFDKISVAAAKVKAPFKVGDVIHIKGHTTDFFQKVESMQIEHQLVTKVKKGDDVGIKVKDFVRPHDLIHPGKEADLVAVQPAQTAPPAKPVVQTAMFGAEKVISPKKIEGKSGTYEGTRFLKF